MQVTVGFVDGVPVMDLARVLEARYNADVTVGQGQTTNGIPINTIIVSPKKQEAS